MKKILPILLPVVISLVLAKFLFGGGGGEPAEEEEPPDTAALRTIEVDEADFGCIQDLDAVTVNLADGRFLKIKLALQMSEEHMTAHAAEAGGHGGGAAEGSACAGVPSPARLLDATNTLLATYAIEDLRDVQTRNAVREELSATARELYAVEGEISVWQVYITEFVMQ